MLETLTVLLLGFLIGMRHALESDHLAAVATMATQAETVRQTMKLGMTWGVGHTLTLFLLGSVVLFMDGIVPERFASGLELIVGIMLVILGLDVIRRMRKRRVHFHVHEHEDGIRHFHAHAHDGTMPHDRDPHHHVHVSGLTWRALIVGMVHGAAGTAALVLLTLQTIHNVPLGLLYILVFGLGSVLGMGIVSVIISLPLLATANRGLTRYHTALQLGIGLLTFAYGLVIIWQLAPDVFG